MVYYASGYASSSAEKQLKKKKNVSWTVEANLLKAHNTFNNQQYFTR
jgi:hypothetical protein